MNARASAAWHHYLNQKLIWLDGRGTEHQILKMSHSHRRNAANWLLKNAERLSRIYDVEEFTFLFDTKVPTVIGMDDFGNNIYGPRIFPYALRGDAANDAYDRAREQRVADPQGWMKEQNLYMALVKGLPEPAEIVRIVIDGKKVQL